MKIQVTVNGKRVEREIPDGMRSIDFLRDICGLTGTKEGCGKGECGACTIIVNGKPVNSCLFYAAKLDGAEVLTIEGLSPREGELHPIQERSSTRERSSAVSARRA
jgi:carbon-monoxide dehydrogenase small subunit